MLAQSDRPLSATTVTRRLREGGEQIIQSAVFRAIAGLFATGLLDRVELTSAYLPRREETSASALCTRCGCYAELKQGAPAQELRALARARGFRPGRLVVEVAGLCRDCIGQDDTG